MAHDVPVPQGEQQYLYDQMRTAYEQDRAFNGYPTCSVVKRVASTDNSFSGDYDASAQAVHSDVECDVEPYSDEQIANASGLIQPDDQMLITYAFEAIDEKTHFIIYEGRYWKVMSQHYEDFANRLEIGIRPMGDQLEDD